MAGGEKERTLEETPTWAVAIVCFVLLAISIIIEHIIHAIGKWLKRNNKTALYEALEKVKGELILLGFISLLLTVFQNPISRICISKNVASTWHPCAVPKKSKSGYEDSDDDDGDDGSTGVGAASPPISICTTTALLILEENRSRSCHHHSSRFLFVLPVRVHRLEWCFLFVLSPSLLSLLAAQQ
ncbi:MLO-like protein [Arachis hypogaea]|nr:MLO-like protein [Arachis hypogaea]